MPTTITGNNITVDTATIGNSDLDTGWITPTLLNGWVNYGGGYAGAAYRRIGNVVYVRGLVKSGTMGANVFELPTAWAPLERLIFPSVSNNAIGRVDVVQTTGGVNAQSGSNAWISLCLTYCLDD